MQTPPMHDYHATVVPQTASSCQLRARQQGQHLSHGSFPGFSHEAALPYIGRKWDFGQARNGTGGMRPLVATHLVSLCGRTLRHNAHGLHMHPGCRTTCIPLGGQGCGR